MYYKNLRFHPLHDEDCDLQDVECWNSLQEIFDSHQLQPDLYKKKYTYLFSYK